MSEETKHSKLTRGCVVYMKQSSNMTGWGNGQCVSNVCEPLGELGFFGHNQQYKIRDIDRIVEYPKSALFDEMVGALEDMEFRLTTFCEHCLMKHKCIESCMLREIDAFIKALLEKAAKL